MRIRPIKTEADYEAALKEVELLFDVKPGTPEADRLEVLTTLIEAYEGKHYSIPLPDPIEAIVYHMESRGSPAMIWNLSLEVAHAFRRFLTEGAH